MDAPHTKRARQRVATIAALKDEARRQLAEVGAQGLSLRAVAREQGMVSSGVYRYFESRDALLTALIVDAYDDLGAAVEQAVAAHQRAGLNRRWTAACTALRAWALDHPHEWGLVYGTPVPGYAAPEDTNVPASRVPAVLMRLAVEADGDMPPPDGAVTGVLRAQAERVNEALGLELPAERVVGVAQAWTLLLGAVSLELFGQYTNTFDPADNLYRRTVTTAAHLAGLS